jgi:hypothetical protein
LRTDLGKRDDPLLLRRFDLHLRDGCSVLRRSSWRHRLDHDHRHHDWTSGYQLRQFHKLQLQTSAARQALWSSWTGSWWMLARRMRQGRHSSGFGAYRFDFCWWQLFGAGRYRRLGSRRSAFPLAPLSSSLRLHSPAQSGQDLLSSFARTETSWRCMATTQLHLAYLLSSILEAFKGSTGQGHSRWIIRKHSLRQLPLRTWTEWSWQEVSFVDLSPLIRLISCTVLL